MTIFGKLPPNCLIEHRPGCWGFVGSVDGRLAYQMPDGAEVPAEIMRDIARFGSGLIRQSHGVRTRVFATAEEALAAAAALGLPVTGSESTRLENPPAEKSAGSGTAGTARVTALWMLAACTWALYSFSAPYLGQPSLWAMLRAVL